MDRDKLKLHMDLFERYIGAYYDETIASPLFKSEEGYKRDIITSVRGVMSSEEWTLEDIGSGIITGQVVEAIRQHENLISYKAVPWYISSIKEKSRDADEAFYALYCGENDEEAFAKITALIGNKYDVVSYLYFIKNPKRYLPVRASIMDKIFADLDISHRLSRKCSWENYIAYIDCVVAIQTELNDYYNHNENLQKSLDLLDAHAFLWTIGSSDYRIACGLDLIDENEENAGEPIRKTEIISIAKEGKKRLVYGVRYERNPKLRKQAIAYHGLKCYCCGFDFQEFYGEIGKDYIEVHHKVPLSESSEMEVDPTTDMVCLCANCHSMLHRRKGQIIDVDVLKMRVRSS